MYTPKYAKLSKTQVTKLKKMHIPNSDSQTDEKKWVDNAKKRAVLDLKTAEKAIGLYLDGK